MKEFAINIISATSSAFILLMSTTGCTNAGASNVDSSGAIAPFRITRGILPQNSTIQQADGLCGSEFGAAYSTATRDEINGLTNINTLQVFLYAFDRSLGRHSEGCPDTYCVVACIHK